MTMFDMPHSRDSSLTALRSRRRQPVLFGPPSALMLSGWAVKAVAFRPQELQKPMFCLLPTSFEFCRVAGAPDGTTVAVPSERTDLRSDGPAPRGGLWKA